VLSGRAAEKWTTSAVDAKTSARETFGEDLVPEGDDFVAAGVDIAVHVSNQVSDTGSLGKVARCDHQHVFVSRADDVRRLRVLVQQLARVKDGAGRQLEREHHAIGRLDQAANAASIGRTHGQFHHSQPQRCFGV